MDMGTQLMANNVSEGVKWLYEEISRRVNFPEEDARPMVASNRAESFLYHLKDDKRVYVQSIAIAAKNCEKFLEIPF